MNKLLALYVKNLVAHISHFDVSNEDIHDSNISSPCNYKIYQQKKKKKIIELVNLHCISYLDMCLFSLTSFLISLSIAY